MVGFDPCFHGLPRDSVGFVGVAREHLLGDGNLKDSVEAVFPVEVGTKLPHRRERERGRERLSREFEVKEEEKRRKEMKRKDSIATPTDHGPSF